MRNSWPLAVVTGAAQDLRSAGRTLRRNQGFTVLAVVLLGLGMGASTAIFSLLDSVLFKSLSVKDPGRLVLLTDPAFSGVSVGTDNGSPRGSLTYAEFNALRQRMTSFSGMFAADSQWRALNARIDGGVPEEVRLRLVSGDYFSTLGATPLMGRTFTSADEHGPGSAPYAVISYSFWKARLGVSAEVLGRRMSIQGTSYTVIGVMPPTVPGRECGRKRRFVDSDGDAAADPARPELVGRRSRQGGTRDVAPGIRTAPERRQPPGSASGSRHRVSSDHHRQFQPV